MVDSKVVGGLAVAGGLALGGYALWRARVAAAAEDAPFDPDDPIPPGGVPDVQYENPLINVGAVSSTQVAQVPRSHMNWGVIGLAGASFLDILCTQPLTNFGSANASVGIFASFGPRRIIDLVGADGDWLQFTTDGGPHVVKASFPFPLSITSATSIQVLQASNSAVMQVRFLVGGPDLHPAWKQFWDDVPNLEPFNITIGAMKLEPGSDRAISVLGSHVFLNAFSITR